MGTCRVKLSNCPIDSEALAKVILILPDFNYLFIIYSVIHNKYNNVNYKSTIFLEMSLLLLLFSLL